MKLHVIGTGSAGNCYLFQCQNQYLIIEAGIRFDEINKIIRGQIKQVQAALITHEHGDHAKFAVNFAERGIKVCTGLGTIERLNSNLLLRIEANKKYRFGLFTVIPFAVSHNAVEPLGFVIHTEESGLIFFATDLDSMPNLNGFDFSHILIESNYCEHELMKANFNGSHSHGTINHLSVQQAANAVNGVFFPSLQNIILLHRSGRMSGENESMINNFDRKELVQIAKNKSVFELDKYKF